MLVRASKRKLRRDARRGLQPAFEQLRLPWLCPALFLYTPNRQRKSTFAKRKQPPAPTQPSPRTRPLTTPPERRWLAYAALIESAPHDPYIPFELPNHQNHSISPPDPPWLRNGSNLDVSFDPTSPLIFKDSLAKAPRNIRLQDGVGGDISDIHAILHACLQVGRLDRAAATMRRLNLIYRPDAPVLIETHNEYLEALMGKIVRTKDQRLLQHVQKWFEVELRGKGIIPNPTTIAIMIRATLQEANQLKIDQTVSGYLAWADEAGIRGEVMSPALGILDEEEIGRVTQISSPTISFETQDTASDDQDHAFSHATSLDTHELVDPEDYQIRSTQQKGLGLKTLQRSLSIFSEPSPPSTDAHDSPELNSPDSAFIRQARIEEDTFTSALDRWRKEHTLQMKQFGVMGTLQSIGSLMWQWHQALVPLIKEDIRAANEAELRKKKTALDLDRFQHGPFLQFLKPEQLSAITILSCVSAIGVYGIDRGTRIANVVMKIGNAVQDESLAQSIKSNSKMRVWKGLGPQEQSKRLRNMTKRLQPHDSLAKMVPEPGKSDFKRDSTWSLVTKTRVGASLLSHVIKVAKMYVSRLNPDTGEKSRENQPAFWNTYEYEGGKRVGVLRMNKALGRKLTKEPLSCVVSKHLPMIVEPVLWTGFNTGGFIKSPVNVVRMGPGHEQNYKYIRAASQSGDMDQIWAGLDVLGKTPWKINRKVFEVMTQAWNTGKAVAKIAAAPSEEQDPDPQEPDSPENSEQHREWERQIRKLKNTQAGQHSQRCFQNFQLEIARAYLNETFYFPHNVDFRGRAYPIPPYLNHMGADNCRGLLLFGKGKELGPAGLVWLKVHLANVFGYDKASLQERQKFTEDRLSEISDSATNSLGGDRWWLKAEDPWQCLAACIELKNALDCEDPAKFMSHLPIHQDGTCNGLQHYAALGGDTIGAKQVNLEPGNRPSDVYTGVAELVQAKIAADADQNIELARMLKGNITRKVVKQTVMTNVYGVTFSGAWRQVFRQLEVMFPDFPRTREVSIELASQYVARKIFTALSTMFNGAHGIQFWLAESASRICESLTPEQLQWIEDDAAGKVETSEFSVRPTNAKRFANEQTSFKSAVIWTTPLRMPVVQPYRNPTARLVKTNLQRVQLKEPITSDPVSKRKQLQAFPPNFIHSLDATHMILSALKCDEVGLSFAAVHDSFWTHAGDVPTMNQILRDAFIRMHSEDIIGRLAVEFSVRYKDHMYLASIDQKSPVGKKIAALRRDRKLSKGSLMAGKKDELLMERRRLRLLASSDPLERTEGESMITAGRIVAETADEKDFVVLEDFEGSIGQLENETLKTSEAIDISLDADISFPNFDQDQSDVREVVDTGRRAEEEEGKGKAKVERRPGPRKQKVWVWLPLKFPPVPKKGDFDVSRLKESQYFFS